MKKFLITILAALLAGGIVSAQSFPDIPGGHWAGDAVEEIADLGIVIGFPDGTFRGNEAFTRYQAALVVSRLLSVIDDNMEAELGSLRSALQELAGDVAAQGVRLAAAESAIAGISDDVAAGMADAADLSGRLDAVESGVRTNADDIASNAQGVAANSQRLDALEAALADMPQGMDEAVLRDLQNQIASQRVAIDTAQAQAEAAEARADGAYDLALQALAASDANASDIAALNAAFQLLSDRVDGMSGPAPMAPEAAPVDLSGIERNAGDIANIREFVILLRRDQVALRDRVSALEAADQEILASVSDLDARVTALETNPLGFSGSIELEYYVGRTLGGYYFDIDRVYGANAPRSMGNSEFSSGSDELNDDDDETDEGELAQDLHDIEQEMGELSTTLNLTVGSGNLFDGAGSPRALNSFTAVITVEIEEGFIFENDDLDVDDGFQAWLFTITDFTTTFDFIGAEPLVFTFGEEVSTQFTNYVFNIDEQVGFVATVSSPDFLSFLNPGLTAAYFSDEADGVLRGIRGTMAPEFGDAIGLSGGVSFVQYSPWTGDKDDVVGDNMTTTVWGADGMVNLLDIVALDFEYANSATDGTANGNVLYVVAEVDGDNLPILNSLGANYRDMDLDFDGLNIDDDDDWVQGDDPFELGQTGFGVEAGLGLFILDVTGFFDSYTSQPSGDENVGFGVEVAAELFAGFSLTGFYQMASIDGNTVDETVNERDVEGYELLDGEYETMFGVGIEHDGAADNALISGLNLAAGYERHTEDFSRTEIYANADYALDISIVSLTPYVGFRSEVDPDVTSDEFNEIVAGIGVRTQALGIYLRPSLQAAANYRSTSWSDRAAGAADFTTTELQWSVGVNLEEFLFANSSLSARVGSWTGTNTDLTLNSVGAGDEATDISGDDDIRDGDTNSGVTENVFGYEVLWDYYDLRIAYGSYTSDRDGDLASAQAFSIKYTVDF